MTNKHLFINTIYFDYGKYKYFFCNNEVNRIVYNCNVFRIFGCNY